MPITGYPYWFRRVGGIWFLRIGRWQFAFCRCAAPCAPSNDNLDPWAPCDVARGLDG